MNAITTLPNIQQDIDPYAHLWPLSLRPGGELHHSPVGSSNRLQSSVSQSANLARLEYFPLRSIRRSGNSARDLYRLLNDRKATLSRTVMICQVGRYGGDQQGSNTAIGSYLLAPSVPIYLVRKPQNWRKDYQSPSKPLGLRRHLEKIQWFFKRRRLGHSLNPLIGHRSFRSSTIIYDLRQSFGQQTHTETQSWDSSRHLNLSQLAISPPRNRLVIWHPKLPWRIQIEATSSSGITVGDIINGIYENLRRTIGHNEYYTVELTSEDRDKLTQVFQVRCQGVSSEIMSGLRRVDFLGNEVYFAGLSYSGDGRWELKTSPTSRRRITLD